MSKKLYIIPGHGAGDPGACAGGYQEADLVRQLAARLKAWGGAKVVRAPYKRDFYADAGITRMVRSTKKWLIVELHMDSASSSAKGAHVIQYKQTSAGKATAKAVAEMLPGRANSLVIRSDLANPKRAAAKGYEYMLVECGFITNSHDRKWVIANMDELAKAILKANGITPRKTPLKVKCPW